MIRLSRSVELAGVFLMKTKFFVKFKIGKIKYLTP